MSNPVSEDDDKPLDPAAQRIVNKIRMMMLIAGATTLIGIGAIFAVIGYRVFKNEGSAAPSPAAAPDVTVTLPRGARIVSTETSDDRLIVTIEANGQTEVRLYDLETLQPAGRLRFSPQP